MNEPPHTSPDSLVGEYLKSRDALVRFLTARTGSAAEAEDLVQDMFLKVQAVDATGIGNPTAFLYRLASNLFLDRLRSARRRQARDDAYAQTHTEAAGLDLVAQTPDPQQVVDSRQRLQQLIKAVESLPPQCRRVFVLHKLDGLSYAEVAGSLGISKSAVEKHMMTALKRLAEHSG
ncbi:MAG: RNA polymerase sigma factor [Hyphomonas sp.]|nr:RNA polymerase sigma factor [Hyphomonas sp.]MCB9961592.1 RNA polymerase sigma factor [Hyphomonas sp.]MCB9971149.1 RNA polymerase sigma factor [Hyphomonas sp.]